MLTDVSGIEENGARKGVPDCDRERTVRMAPLSRRREFSRLGPFFDVKLADGLMEDGPLVGAGVRKQLGEDGISDWVFAISMVVL